VTPDALGEAKSHASLVHLTSVGLLSAAFTLLAACSSSAARNAAGGRAGLLVVEPDGSLRRACVQFDGPQTTGEGLLQRSGLAVSLDAGNPMGVLVCSIDHQGCDFPSQQCFCQCRTLGSCAYWAYFLLGTDGKWAYASQGARAQVVRDGDMNAWVWLTPGAGAQAAGLPSVTFAQVCGQP
jgi:hypothetical protein